MTIKWYGHSCFLITDENGVRILTDPMDASTGYTPAPIESDIVTVSHAHHDHNNLALAAGEPRIVSAPGEYDINGIKIKGVRTFHDEAQGAKRGDNIFFIFTVDSMRVAHAGDLGVMPDERAIDEIGPIDVLLIPIGGVYTVGPEEARAVANRLHPKVLIPMHYATPALKFELGGLAPFVDAATGCSTHFMRQSEAHLSPESLGEDRILILDYEK